MRNEPLPYEEDPRAEQERIALAWSYLKAVAVASAVFGFQFLATFGSARLAIDALLICLLIALVTALIPFLISVWIARKWAIRSVVYYMICGTITAAILAPLYPNRIEPCKWDPNCGATFWDDYVEGFGYLILPSIVGAVTVWIAAGRRLGR